MKRVLGLGLLVIVAGPGCATAPGPSVHAYPARGQSAEQVARDTAECQAWARQQTGYDPAADTAKGVAVGTLLGGALGAGGGAAVGAATGTGVGRGAATGAVLGGVAGGVAGGVHQYAKSREGYNQAYAACMTGRGYTTGATAPAVPAPTVSAPPSPAAVVVQPAPVVAAPAPAVVAAPRRIRVPPGHYPPPGHCRLWYADRPPGHQPPPFRCQAVAVPRGAFILYEGVAWDADYDWRSHAARHPGSVPAVILEMTAGR